MNNRIPKILVVDDETVNCKLIEEYLKSYNIEVLVAGSGLQAIEQCRRNPDISVILMDILMREMNGFQAAEIIQNLRKDIVIIFQTAYANEFLKDELMKNLACGYIEKPIRKEVLLNEVGKYINITRKEMPVLVKSKRSFSLMNIFSLLFH